MIARRPRWNGLMRSDVLMKDLLKDDSEVPANLLAHGLGESVPDVSGRDGHGAWHLSTSERRSWIASTVSLVRACAGGQDAASWVAGTGILSDMNSRYET